MKKIEEEKKTILVVDDESDQIFSVKQIFEHENKYEVKSANSGEECLNFLRNNNIPDIILLDIMMPRMNGLEVYNHIRKKTEWKDIPIIIITAMGGKEKITDEDLSPDDYIEKPYDVEDLKNRVDRILNKLG
jgi:CheY-like chemotaxis protein